LPGSDGADGSNGADGAPGTAATIAVGTVTTGAAGSNVTVTNTGDSTAAVFAFSIPAGKDGKDGAGVNIVGPLLTYPPTATPNSGDMWITADPIPVGVPDSAEGPAVVGDGIVFNGTDYVNVGRIQGPPGPQGERGYDGAQGNDGADGNDGEGGQDGADGTDGLNNEVYVQVAEPTAQRPGAIWIDPS
jgi:hypothetical protein